MNGAPELVLHSSLLVPIADYLRPLLAEHGYSDVFIGRQIPSTRPNRMVVLSNNGGFDVNVAIAQATVSINVWAQTDTDADTLAQLVTGLLKNAEGYAPIESVDVVTYPTDVIDATGMKQRFCRFNIRHVPNPTT
jgi:hypothetical protein